MPANWGSVRAPTPSSVKSKSKVVHPLGGSDESDGSLVPILIRTFKTAGVAIAVWGWGYLGFSIAWVYIAFFCHIANRECRKQKDSKKNYAQQAVKDERSAITSRVEDQLSWVYFPELEKAEWLNKIAKQMWPFIGKYVKRLLENEVQESIQSSENAMLKSFKFVSIDIGDNSPRIEGLKMYIDAVKKDEIICDLDINYNSDANIKVEVKGVVSGIKALRVTGLLRVIMKPLINNIPIIGGLSIFFLNRPMVSFDLTAAANILDMPMLKKTLRSQVVETISNYLVLPNRIPISLSSSLDPLTLAMMKYPLPQGVIALRVVEADELKRADKNVFGKGKSDPYCKVSVGGRTVQTRMIKETLKPQWGDEFELIVDQKHGQFVLAEVFDFDTARDDDSLGTATVDIELLAKAGIVDLWLPLEEVDTGKIHIQAIWLNLCKDLSGAFRRLDIGGSTAILIVNLEKAVNLPWRGVNKAPNSFVKFKLHSKNEIETSNARGTTCSPEWNENFQFLILDQENEKLEVEIYHRGKTDKLIASFPILLRTISTADNPTSRVFQLAECSANSSISLRLCMRLLTSDAPTEVEGPVPVVPLSPNRGQMDQQPPVETIGTVSPPPVTFLPTVASEVRTEEGPERTGQKGSFADVPNVPRYVEPEERNLLSDPRPKKVAAKAAARDGTQSSEATFGKIHLTVRYSTTRGQLVVVVHECKNLIPCDKDNLADPYVRLYVMPDHSSGTRKRTKMVKNSLNPTFDETFEWTMPINEASSRSLDIAVKNDVTLFSKSRTDMGNVVVDLSRMGDLLKATSEWFELQDPASRTRP